MTDCAVPGNTFTEANGSRVMNPILLAGNADNDTTFKRNG